MAAFIGALAATMQTAAGPLPKRAELAALFPAKSETRVIPSPSGKHLAILDGRTGTIQNLDRPDDSRHALGGGITELFWYSPKDVVFQGPRTRNRQTGHQTLGIWMMDAERGTRRELAGSASNQVREGSVRLIPTPGAVDRVHFEIVFIVDGISWTSLGTVDVQTGRVEIQQTIHDGPTSWYPMRRLYDRTGAWRIKEQGQVADIEERLYYWYDTPGFGWTGLDVLHPNGSFGQFSRTLKDDLEPHSVPLGFGHDPRVLFVATDVNRSTYGIFGWNLESGERLPLGLEFPHLDLIRGPADSFSSSVLLTDGERVVGVRPPGDRSTRWIDPAFATIQTSLEQRFPDRPVQIRGWASDRSRIVFWVGSHSDDGRHFVWDTRGSGRFEEILRPRGGAPSLGHQPTEAFQLRSSEGIELHGLLVRPRNSIVENPPVVVFCGDMTPGRPAESVPVARDLQALAAMGFIALQVDYRGTPGRGRAHRDAALAALDEIPLGDINAALAWIAKERGVNVQRVALVGEGAGAHLALRAMEVQPSRFACAIAINSPPNLDTSVFERLSAVPNSSNLQRLHWLRGMPAGAEAPSALREIGRIVRPVLIMQDSAATLDELNAAQALRRGLRQNSRDSESFTIRGSLERLRGLGRADVLLEIGGFLNSHAYDFVVNTEELREVEP